jgi:hypothetical protein
MSDKKQLETYKTAIRALRDKIEEQTPTFLEADLYQEVIVGTGELVRRSNPVVVEYRALVKDYGVALKNYRDLAGDKAAADVTSLSEIRSRLKVAK